MIASAVLLQCTDIWAMGVILFRLIAGFFPFCDQNPDEPTDAPFLWHEVSISQVSIAAVADFRVHWIDKLHSLPAYLAPHQSTKL